MLLNIIQLHTGHILTVYQTHTDHIPTAYWPHTNHILTRSTCLLNQFSPQLLTGPDSSIKMGTVYIIMLFLFLQICVQLKGIGCIPDELLSTEVVFSITCGAQPEFCDTKDNDLSSLRPLSRRCSTSMLQSAVLVSAPMQICPAINRIA